MIYAQAKANSLMLAILPFTVFAFSAPAVAYVNSIITTDTRWLALALLFMTTAVRLEIFSIFQSAPGAMALTYASWCLATSLWSEVTLLSTMKASALLVLVVTMFAAGQMWLRLVPIKEALTYSLALAALALFCALAGTASPSAQVALGTGVVLYQGLTSNPNMFGSLLAMGLPVLVWRSYLAWTMGRTISIWSLVTACLLFFLILSVSRASMLTALMTFCGLFIAMKPKHRVLLGTLAVSATVLALVIAPSVKERAAIYFKKGGSSITFSREQVWAVSYEHAKQGGLIGVGYGVTAGQSNFEFNFTAFGYGREKGNSQLAIAEETGLVGLALYFAFILATCSSIWHGMRQCRDSDTRVLLGIMSGAWIGMLVNSLFEAWWVAPGAPETVWFWSLSGVIIAMTQALKAASAAPLPQSSFLRAPHKASRARQLPARAT